MVREAKCGDKDVGFHTQPLGFNMCSMSNQIPTGILYHRTCTGLFEIVRVAWCNK